MPTLPRPGDVYKHKINGQQVRVLTSESNSLRFQVLLTNQVFNVEPEDFDHDFYFVQDG